MGLFDFWKSKPESQRVEPVVDTRHAVSRGRHGAARNFAAAAVNRFTADWLISYRDADAELRMALPRMRAVSRDLERNGNYGRRFLALVARNVIGHKGIVLQAQSRRDDGSLDQADNKKIEAAWEQWGQLGVCTVDGLLSWVDAQRLMMRSIARDGEVLVRFIRGANAGNKFNFALQILEGDHLDETHNAVLDNGNIITMGVEKNKYGRPVAYHLLTRHPGSDNYIHAGRERERVPADQILHLFMVERAGQTRGIPWLHSSIPLFKMLGGYEEAELIAARIAASKMGFYERKEEGQQYAPDDTTQQGDLVQEVAPGHFEELPVGVSVTAFDPQHPNAAFPDFRKAMLRGAASGLDVSYNGLANDLEGVNYSSLRQGSLDERDAWRTLQTYFKDAASHRVYLAWLDMALLSQALPLPPRKVWKFQAVAWQPRGWQWVDPEKEVNASLKAIGGGLRSRQDVLAEQGRDVTDTMEQLAEENQLAQSIGLVLADPSKVAGNPQPQQPETSNNG